MRAHVLVLFVGMLLRVSGGSDLEEIVECREARKGFEKREQDCTRTLLLALVRLPMSPSPLDMI